MSIFAGVNGYLDDVSLNNIKQFETKLLELIKENNNEIIDQLNSTGKLEDEMQKKISEIILEMKKEIEGMPSLDDLKKE